MRLLPHAWYRGGVVQRGGALLLALMHRTAWSGPSPKFVNSSEERFEKAKKRTYEHSKFIGNSSGVGTNAGLTHIRALRKKSYPAA